MMDYISKKGEMLFWFCSSGGGQGWFPQCLLWPDPRELQFMHPCEEFAACEMHAGLLLLERFAFLNQKQYGLLAPNILGEEMLLGCFRSVSAGLEERQGFGGSESDPF